MALNSKSSISLFILILVSCAFVVGYAQGGVDALSCLQKLLPCQPYIKSSSPPASCCNPLKDIVANQAQCLCAVFTNPEILKGTNVTLQDGLNLAKSCGVNADVSICTKAAAAPAPASPLTPGAPKSSHNSSSISSPPPRKSSAHRAGGSLGFIAIICFIVSAFNIIVGV